MSHAITDPAHRTEISGAAFFHPFTALKKRAAEWRQRRAAAKELSRLGAEQLRDIGLTKGDLAETHDPPLSFAASDAVYLAALGRSCNR